MAAQRGVEFLLRADLQGRVLAVPEVVPHLRARLASGAFLAELVADASAGDLLDFLLSVRRDGAAVSNPLELVEPSRDEHLEPVWFVLGGILRAEGMLVWGASTAPLARSRGAAWVATPRDEGSARPSAAALRLFGGPSTAPSAEAMEALSKELAAARAEIDRLREELERLQPAGN